MASGDRKVRFPVGKKRKSMRKQFYYNNHLEIVQISLISSACHAVFAFLITTLIGFLQLKYQSQQVAPFQTHPTNIKAFFTCLCVYYSILVAKAILFQTHSTRYSRILTHVCLISGFISSLSLLTIFLTSWLTKLISILGVFIPLILRTHLMKVIYQQLCEKTINAVKYVVDVYRRLTRQSSMEQPNQLV